MGPNDNLITHLVALKKMIGMNFTQAFNALARIAAANERIAHATEAMARKLDPEFKPLEVQPTQGRIRRSPQV